MTELDGVTVGLEIHQQLATGRKLFCSCMPAESEEYHTKFYRKMRSARDEMGKTDRAAIFEGAKSRDITYYAGPASCLVERDEEPPHGMDPGSRRTALVIALALDSKVFDEVYPMRKTVVDGSNTSGFQRTMLVSMGGSFGAGKRRIGIQSICLEEDAAKIVDGGYGLGRLGVPLVEIATEPFAAGGGVREVALALGRMLRGTGMARRGIGSIRQDVNVSVEGGGAVTEVKGVQQLDQLERVVEYEASRQRGMLQISAEIKKRGWTYDPGNVRDVTGLFEKSESRVVNGALKKGHMIQAVLFGKMAGAFGYEPYKGVRLGRDVAELVRVLGLGGIFHSDELPAYGITKDDISRVKNTLGAGDGDGFVLLAGPPDMMPVIVRQIVQRIEHIRDHGIPTDTRMATQDGETVFLRPRPGAARMYPETDVPPVIITKTELAEARTMIPRPWEERLAGLQKYGLNRQLAEQLLDSRYVKLFEKVAGDDPTFAASALCYTITSLEREGLDPGLLNDAEIARMFEMLGKKEIAKESVEIIFKEMMSGRASTVEEAIKGASIGAVGADDLERIIEGIVEKNLDLVRNQKERAAGPLMGMIMKEVRGKAPGETVSRLLLDAIRKRI